MQSLLSIKFLRLVNQKRKNIIEDAGLTWSVVESIPVHEEIKTRSGRYKQLLETYKQNLRNVAACGIRTVCYNFMPVLDWTRTELYHTMPDGAKALRFSWTDLAVFDVHILKRKGSEADYSADQLQKAESIFKKGDRMRMLSRSRPAVLVTAEANQRG